MSTAPIDIRSREDMARTPLPERRTKDESSIVKIVHAPEGDFLSEWSFGDIKLEPYGIHSKRPMVYMTDAHEAIEKSMWCYENGMVPLIGEADPDIATLTAERYEIDQLITDPEASAKLVPYLLKRTEPLLSMSVIAPSFAPESLLPLAAYAREVRLILALPEVGVIAEAPLSETPVFHMVSGCAAAAGETLVVTKQQQLVTPIVEYDTAIRVDARSLNADGSIESLVLRL